jgi:hypothetical protein
MAATGTVALPEFNYIGPPLQRGVAALSWAIILSALQACLRYGRRVGARGLQAGELKVQSCDALTLALSRPTGEGAIRDSCNSSLQRLRM